ncbi:MAG: hypothetical protein GX059_00750 [Clostridiales bacterium]|nr:hypothetical protein [Clostridiales bacterium]
MQHAVKEDLLDYASFVSFIKNEVAERMGQDYTIRVIRVMKNNSVELDSLVVLKNGDNSAPNIYLQPYYESYLSGTPLTGIIDRICKAYENFSIPVLRKDFEYTFERMRPYIFFRLINLKRNEKLLSQIPYVKFLDLAITFHCLVRNEKENIGTIRISNRHLEEWQVTRNDLMKLAAENTRKLFPPVIKPMEEAIREVSADVMYEDNMDFDSNESSGASMYVLTNEKGLHGASSLLYPDVIREFAYHVDADLFILPSSVHEIILMPVRNPDDRQKLQKMVREVNSVILAPDEILSDNVYIYSLESDQIFL